MRLIASILILLLTGIPAFAVDRYVSPTGGGTSCTSGSPCTIAYAMSQTTTPGDRVLCADGTYNLTAGVSAAAAGTAENRMVLTYYQTPRGPVFDFGGANVNGVTLDYGYWTIEGITVQNCAYSGIKSDGDVHGTASSGDYGNYGGYGERNWHVNGANGITIRNNYVNNVGFDGIKLGHQDDLLIENNEVYKAGLINLTSPTSHQQGIDMVGVYNSTIRGNYVHDDSAGTVAIGIFFKGGSQNIVCENNRVQDIPSPYSAIEIGGDTEWYSTRYTVADVSNANINTDILSDTNANNRINETGTFAGTGTYEAAHMAEARNCIIRNNLVINSDPGISARGDYNSLVYHNTLIETGWSQYPFKLDDDGVHLHISSGGRYYNNLVYNDTASLPTTSVFNFKNSPTVSATDYNLAYSSGQTLVWGTGTTPNTHSILNTNPSINGSYQPDSGTDPIVNAGLNLLSAGVISSEITDYAGVFRPQGAGYDIGAYELVDSSDSTAPTVTISTTDPSTVTANSLSISGTASDVVGVSGCKYRVGSVPDATHGTDITGTTSWSGIASGFSSGSNTLYVGCYDAAGNYGTDSMTVTYNPPANGHIGGSGVFSFGGDQ